MKARIEITDTGEGSVEINVEAIDGSFSKDGEKVTLAEGLCSAALSHIQNLLQGEIAA